MHDQSVDEVLGSGILDWYFLGNFYLFLDLDHAVYVDDFCVGGSQGVEDEGIGADADVGVLALEFLYLFAVELSSYVELVDQGTVLLILLDPHFSF